LVAVVLTFFAFSIGKSKGEKDDDRRFARQNCPFAGNSASVAGIRDFLRGLGAPSALSSAIGDNRQTNVRKRGAAEGGVGSRTATKWTLARAALSARRERISPPSASVGRFSSRDASDFVSDFVDRA
jgi:hypothetical protein